ncbi:zinc ion binding [Sparganum proliferum]
MPRTCSNHNPVAKWGTGDIYRNTRSWLRSFMDLTSAFQKIVADKRFSTYEEFEEALRDFKKQTGVEFARGRATYHPEGTIKRANLLIANAEYVCRCKRSTECEAAFKLGSRRLSLHIIKFYMLHNHEACQAAPEEEKEGQKEGDEHAPPAYEVLEDLTPEFVRFFPSDRMDSYEALNERLRQFQQATGSVYVLGRSNKWSQKERESAATAGLTYKNVTLQCVHFGSGNSRHLSDTSGARFNRTVRIGCKSRIYVSSVRGGVELVSFDMRHNHRVSVQMARLYCQNRRLSPQALQEAAKLIAKNIDNFALWRYLQDFYNPNLTREDVRRLKGKLKKTALSSSAPLAQPASPASDVVSEGTSRSPELPLAIISHMKPASTASGMERQPEPTPAAPAKVSVCNMYSFPTSGDEVDFEDAKKPRLLPR